MEQNINRLLEARKKRHIFNFDKLLGDIRERRNRYGDLMVFFGDSDRLSEFRFNTEDDIIKTFFSYRNKEEKFLKYYDYGMAKDKTNITAFVVTGFYMSNGSPVKSNHVLTKDNMSRMKQDMENMMNLCGVTAEIHGEQGKEFLKLYSEEE